MNIINVLTTVEEEQYNHKRPQEIQKFIVNQTHGAELAKC